jgi:hypothetical protein
MRFQFRLESKNWHPTRPSYQVGLLLTLASRVEGGAPYLAMPPRESGFFIAKISSVGVASSTTQPSHEMRFECLMKKSK